MRSVRDDVSFAFRSFRKTPGFAATVIVTLAITIGASTTMFSIVNGVLLNPLPIANGDRVVWSVNRGTRPYDAMSPPDYADWQRAMTSFEATATWVTSRAALGGAVAPEELSIADVTDSWFSMLGVRMQYGRGFSRGEEGVGQPKVAVLSDGLWRTQFAGDPHAIGRTIQLDGTPYTIIGVAPPRFDFPDRVQLWRPMALNTTGLTCRGCRFFHGPIALLARNVSFDRARSETRIAMARQHALFPESEDGLDYEIQPLREHLIGNTRGPLLILLGAVACLLLIACANVGTLFLVRTTTRRAEMGVRMALGAARGRIVRQLLVESMALAAVGGAIGVALAAAGVRTIARLASTSIPAVVDISVDIRVAAVALVTMMLAAMVFGLAPAVQAARTPIVDALKSGGRAASGSRAVVGSQGVFLASQIALVVPLLIAASLLVTEFARLVARDPGFTTDGVIRFDLSLPVCGTLWARDTTCAGVRGPRYTTQPQIQRVTQTLIDALRRMPGTVNAAAGFGVPFTTMARQQNEIVIKGAPPPPKDRPNIVEEKEVTPGYFATLGIPVLRGRDFTDADRFGGPQVAIVSQGAVRAYFGGADPIGKVLEEQGTIIGVVGDTKTQALSGDPEPAVYVSFNQTPVGWLTVLVRSTAPPATTIAGARAAVAAIDRTLPLDHVEAFRTTVDASASSTRLAAAVLAGFAGAALLLAIIGVYGLISYAVRTRHRELGIRIALGAPAGGLVAMILRGALVFVGAGVAAGLVISILGTRVAGSLVPGIDVHDPVTYGGAMVSIVAVAALAAWLPARRAARIDPLVTMRPE